MVLAAVALGFGPGTAFATDGEEIGGVAVDEAVNALAANHAAVLDGPTSYTEMVSAVGQARERGLDLWALSTARSMTNDQAAELAAAIQIQTGGTVIVLSPESIGVHSATLSSDDEEDARSAAATASGGDPGAVRAFTESATKAPFPWALVVIGLLVGVILLGFVGGLWEKRRRRRQDTAALADLTNGLSVKVSDLAPTIVSLSEKVEITQRQDLEDRFNAASSEYTVLRDQLAAPLASRRDVDAAAAKVTALTTELKTLQTEIDAVIDATKQD